MRWAGPYFTVGFAAAVIVAIVTCIFWAQGSLSKEVALPTLAICSIPLSWSGPPV